MLLCERTSLKLHINLLKKTKEQPKPVKLLAEFDYKIFCKVLLIYMHWKCGPLNKGDSTKLKEVVKIWVATISLTSLRKMVQVF